MKRILSLIIVSIFLSNCTNNNIDCTKLIKGISISEFSVEIVSLSEKKFNKYLLNEEKYNQQLIELEVKQIEDTLAVKYFKLGGSAIINCVEIDKSSGKIDVTNYESNYLKEITMRKIEYKIVNANKLNLGRVEFVELKK